MPSVPVAEVAGIANRPAIAGGDRPRSAIAAARCGGRFGTSISSPPGAVTYELAGGPPLHAEVCAPDSSDGASRPANFDSRRALTTEEIEQQLTRQSNDASRGFPAPGRYGVGRPGPLELKACSA